MSKFNFNLAKLNQLDRYNDFFAELVVNDVADFENPKNNAIYFVNDQKFVKPSKIHSSLILSRPNVDYSFLDKSNFIYECENPRLEYAIILNFILKKSSNKEYKVRDDTSIIGKNAVIGENTIIEPGAFIDEGVVIGSNCLIQSGARIYPGVNIGNQTVVGANTTIGLDGFAVEKDEEGNSYRIPHLGGVLIGDRVIISSLCNIHAGTINPTVIENYVQLDSLVHIAHNCHIRESVFIAASAEISGSVLVENGVFVGPNTSIINKISIGSNSIIGLGAVVTKSFSANSTIAGNPADHTYNLAKKSRSLKKVFARIENTSEGLEID